MLWVKLVCVVLPVALPTMRGNENAVHASGDFSSPARVRRTASSVPGKYGRLRFRGLKCDNCPPVISARNLGAYTTHHAQLAPLCVRLELCDALVVHAVNIPVISGKYVVRNALGLCDNEWPIYVRKMPTGQSQLHRGHDDCVRCPNLLNTVNELNLLALDQQAALAGSRCSTSTTSTATPLSSLSLITTSRTRVHDLELELQRLKQQMSRKPANCPPPKCDAAPYGCSYVKSRKTMGNGCPMFRVANFRVRAAAHVRCALVAAAGGGRRLIVTHHQQTGNPGRAAP